MVRKRLTTPKASTRADTVDRCEFEAASEAAELWVNTVAMIAKLGQRGNIEAYPLVVNLQESYDQHGTILERMREDFAAQSDSPVRWERGRGLSGIAHVPDAVYPHIWSSAHEAAAGMARLTLEMLALSVAEITDPAERRAVAAEFLARRSPVLAVPINEVADLQERIRRERAKILSTLEKRKPAPNMKRRGAPETNNPAEDKKLVAAWQAAKGQGASRADFCRGRGIRVQELIDAQQREKYRKRRDA